MGARLPQARRRSPSLFFGFFLDVVMCLITWRILRTLGTCYWTCTAVTRPSSRSAWEGTFANSEADLTWKAPMTHQDAQCPPLLFLLFPRWHEIRAHTQIVLLSARFYCCSRDISGAFIVRVVLLVQIPALQPRVALADT
jgi:hypothetical protein